VEGWKGDVRIALGPRAGLCQFEDAWSPQSATTQNTAIDLRSELTARLEALEAIERQLMEEGG